MWWDYLLLSQNTPEYGCGQTHLCEFPFVSHVPPLLHGSGKQVFTSEIKNVLENQYNQNDKIVLLKFSCVELPTRICIEDI